MLLLQLRFEIYSVLNEIKIIFLNGLICPYTLISPIISLCIALVTVVFCWDTVPALSVHESFI